MQKLCLRLLPIAMVFIQCASHRSSLVKSARSNPYECGCRGDLQYRLYPGDVLEIYCVRDIRKKNEYVVQVEDRLFINFPSFADYTLTQPVKPDGNITLPRVGTYEIAGKTLSQARSEISHLFSEKSWNPEFFIVIEEFDIGLQRIQDILTNGSTGRGREIRVRSDGYLDLPFIGEFPVGGKALESVRREVQERYAAEYPRLLFEVHLTESARQTVYVYGEVTRPGEYPVTRFESVYELFAGAGGVTPFGEMGSIFVLRVEDDAIQCRRLDLTRYKTNTQTDCLALCRGDIVFVPRTHISSLTQLMEQLSRILFFRGFGVGFQWGIDFADITTE